MLYSKTNFYKSQPPQLPQQFWGGAISQTGLPQNSISTSPSPITMTPCYILKRTFTKAQQFNWGGVAISQTGLPQNSISTSPSPITMTPCYILKRTFTKAQQFGGCYLANRITTKLHLHFPLPHYNDTMLYSKTNFYKSQPPQLPQQIGGGGAISQTGLPQNSISTSPSPITMTPCYILKRTFTKVNLLNYPNNLGRGCYLANRITTKLHLHFPLPHYNDTVLYSKTNFYKSQPPQLPQQLGGCYLANRITTKLYHHFPLPHYNDTVLYFKTIFDKSQPPQYPRHLGGYLKKQGHHKTSPLLTMTSCYILKQISTKANLLDSPNTWGGGAITQTGLPQNSTFPLTIIIMWCYISKRSFTNVNLLNSPNSWGVVISQTGLPQNSTSPPNDVVLHAKANFNKSQPPQFPQQKSQNIIFG